MNKFTEDEIIPIRSDSSDGQEPNSGKREPFTVVTIVMLILFNSYLIFQILRSASISDFFDVGSFNMIFTSILMQAFPFMLIGVLISSAMHVFIPDGWLVKVFPTKFGLGFLTALFAGALFPVCECAIVPVMTRLVKKGVAPGIAVTFMLSAPIINPIVVISTLYAFPGQPKVALLRVAFGLGIALLVGILISVSGLTKNVILRPEADVEEDVHCCEAHTEEEPHTHHDGCECACCQHEHAASAASKWRTLFNHAGEEFFDVGKYLVVGALLTSLARTLVPESSFTTLGTQKGLSLFVMMTAAFLFSACSTSDAFIGRGFSGSVPLGAIMGFLVFGPMMDVKNILMLFSGFKKKYVLGLAAVIFVLNFAVLYGLAFSLM